MLTILRQIAMRVSQKSLYRLCFLAAIAAWVFVAGTAAQEMQRDGEAGI